MAQAEILARNQYITMGPSGGTLHLVVCVTDASTSNSRAINDAASRCSPTNKTLGIKTETLSFNYQRQVQPTSPTYSGKQLWDWYDAGTLIDYTRGPATPVTGDIVESGTGYITQCDETDPEDGVCTGSITITITDNHEQVVTA